MLTNNQVWELCQLGMFIFFAGGAAGGYMMLKTGRWTAAAAIAAYKRDARHSRLPIAVLFLCVPLGVIIVFGAILVG